MGETGRRRSTSLVRARELLDLARAGDESGLASYPAETLARAVMEMGPDDRHTFLSLLDRVDEVVPLLPET